ncbi:MAG: hypothetical protein COV44_08135 [Deltaproteobacteria bacterium CG11_big_fil_rev_8_21_14_0_20_45_16]|nr:MAG: hypothetical protein COV44_08135 [Deltaproteobacteria bacterium CG11_big_fil_rev_8_21_14_0_20_45_16]
MFYIELTKDRFKFSVAHFTILSPTQSERLHGHNYYLNLKFGFSELDKDLALAVDMNLLKDIVQTACDKLDERVLVAEKSPYLELHKDQGSLEIKFQKKVYRLPLEDVLLLPLTNISCEALAEYLARELALALRGKVSVQRLTLQLSETRGQAAVYTTENP